MKSFTCKCEGEGWCDYYQRQLWGRQWSISHGVDCTGEEYDRYHSMLIRSAKPTEAKPEGLAMASRKTGGPKKPCNCKNKKAP